MRSDDLCKLLDHLLAISAETEWIEFKHNNSNEIGEYISSIANSACFNNQPTGYLIFGIEDQTRNIVGTSFNPESEKVKEQELINWLDTQFEPGAQFTFHTFEYEGQPVVIVEIKAAIGYPVKFRGEAYIRVGTYKKKLKDHPAKEKSLWEKLNSIDFESLPALQNLSEDETLSLLDYPSVFKLLKIPLPPNKEAILDKLEEEELISRKGELVDITNLGGLLFASKLESFPYLRRKAVRVIVYNGKNRNTAAKEQIGAKGYASGFEGLIRYINEQIPSNELIGKALRTDTKMYPAIAIRELLANTLVHQDLTIKGTGPLIEIFEDRIEFSNPGKPLIDVLRFLDHAPRSRNEKMAKLLRRMGICEERGSGIDKVVQYVEIFQLPPPDFQTGDDFTRVILYSHRDLRGMDRKDKVRATYQHACLKFVDSSYMTNETLRARFNINKSNYPLASRIIADTMEDKLIKSYDSESKSRKYAKYVPFWA